MRDLARRVAVVTGAASGIGRHLAIGLAAEGCSLAIVDVNRQGLEQTASLIKPDNIRITIHVVDVSDCDRMSALFEEVMKEHGKADIVINNAGVAHGGTIREIDYDDFEWVMRINFWGVVYGVKAFLPYLLERNEGHIVNLSSMAGFYTVPYMGAYNVSKSAVRAFSETLYQEIQGTGVGITSVHPSGVKTNMARNSRSSSRLDRNKVIEDIEKRMLTSPEWAAKQIIKAIKKKKFRLIVGWDAWCMYFVGRFFPKVLLIFGGILSKRLFEKNLIGEHER